MSRLTERLAAAERELAQLKRSCQFTALAEMLSAGEEYANEVWDVLPYVPLTTTSSIRTEWEHHRGPRTGSNKLRNMSTKHVPLRHATPSHFVVAIVHN